MAEDSTQQDSQIDVSQAIQARGTDFVMGLDVDRDWATGAQVFLNPQNALIVFREQNVAVGPNGLEVMLRNVSSVVMPLDVTRELHRVLGEQLASIDATDNQ